MSELKSIKQEGNELCWEIEKLPASEQQTRVIVMACAFVSRAEKAEGEVKELKEELDDTAAAGLKDASLAAHLYLENKKLESSLAALREHTRWRKVEEELPENGETVWMLDRNGFIYTYNYYTGLSLSPMYTHWRPISLPDN